MQTRAITIRISERLLKRLHKATSKPLSPSQSDIVRRGIELALEEYESGDRKAQR